MSQGLRVVRSETNRGRTGATSGSGRLLQRSTDPDQSGTSPGQHSHVPESPGLFSSPVAPPVTLGSLQVVQLSPSQQQRQSDLAGSRDEASEASSSRVRPSFAKQCELQGEAVRALLQPDTPQRTMVSSVALSPLGLSQQRRQIDLAGNLGQPQVPVSMVRQSPAKQQELRGDGVASVFQPVWTPETIKVAYQSLHAALQQPPFLLKRAESNQVVGVSSSKLKPGVLELIQKFETPLSGPAQDEICTQLIRQFEETKQAAAAAFTPRMPSSYDLQLVVGGKIASCEPKGFTIPGQGKGMITIYRTPEGKSTRPGIMALACHGFAVMTDGDPVPPSISGKFPNVVFVVQVGTSLRRTQGDENAYACLLGEKGPPIPIRSGVPHQTVLPHFETELNNDGDKTTLQGILKFCDLAVLTDFVCDQQTAYAGSVTPHLVDVIVAIPELLNCETVVMLACRATWTPDAGARSVDKKIVPMDGQWYV